MPSDTECPRMKGNKTRSPRNSSSSPPSVRNLGEYDEERNSEITKASIASIRDSIKCSSHSMAAAAEALKSEYEHWEEIAEGAPPEGGCQPGCSNGTETVTAFGEVVTEVFDLINEVAFPEVIDLAKEEDEGNPDTDGDSSYKEDDDSMFNRSDEYSKIKHAKEFLGFIGAVKPDTKQIITTPVAPPSLLTPDGMPLNLPADTSSLLEILSKEEVVEETEPQPEGRDDNCEYEGTEVHDNDGDDGSVTKSRSKRSVRSKSPDRYSSIDGSGSSEEWSSSNDDSDWCDEKSETKTEGKYKTYIESMVNKNKQTTSFSQPKGAPTMPRAPNGAARIKSVIAHKFKHGFARTKNKYSKPPLVGGEDQSELLTIVESSDEDAHTSEEEEEDAKSQYKEVQHPDKYQHVDDEERTGNKPEEAIKRKEIVEDGDEEEDKDKEVHEDRSSSSEASESSYSVYNEAGDDDDGDDRTYVSYTMSEDDSFFELDDASVTYSIGAKHTEESVTHHSKSYEEEESYESVTLHTQSVGSSEYDRSVTEEHETSVAEELLREGEDNQNGPNQLCSVYDNLYPADSLFSFITRDESESIFDFSDSNPSPENGSLEPPTSVVLHKNSLVESDDEEAPEDYEQVDAHTKDQEERDQLQEDRGEEEKGNEQNIVDSEHYRGSGNGVTEERDGAEKDHNEDNGIEDEEGERKHDKQISASTSPLISTEEVKTKELIDTPGAPDEPQIDLILETNCVEGNTKAKDETSNSNKISSRNESTDDKTGFKLNRSSQDRETRYRRQLSRVRMFNQHRHTIRKLQHKME